jgi:hypothetical protein
MNYLLFKNYDHYAIVNDDADFIVGRVRPLDGREGPFSVEAALAPDECDSEITIVNSVEEALPALASFYEKNLPQWRRESATRWVELTQFANLRIEQDKLGNWLAYRDDYPMLRDVKPAVFATSEEAQRAAEAHLLDYYPNAKPIDDGFSWLPDPEIGRRSSRRIDARAQWQRNAGGSLPEATPRLWSSQDAKVIQMSNYFRPLRGKERKR